MAGESFFDPDTQAGAWFDSDLDELGWFDPELPPPTATDIEMQWQGMTALPVRRVATMTPSGTIGIKT
jgi:hypothetical protein